MNAAESSKFLTYKHVRLTDIDPATEVPVDTAAGEAFISKFEGLSQWWGIIEHSISFKPKGQIQWSLHQTVEQEHSAPKIGCLGPV